MKTIRFRYVSINPTRFAYIAALMCVAFTEYGRGAALLVGLASVYLSESED